MNQGKYIFAQLIDFLPRRIFDRFVDNYEGNKYVRSFSCWNQMLCTVFGQLTARDSMRDLMLSLEAHQLKYYHLGFGSTVSRRNLGTANERHNYKIFEEFAYVLIEEARKSCYRDDFEIEVDGNVYALDSTTIDLCLSIFWWAEFRKHKGGIKLHTLYDVKTSIPSFLYIPNAIVHDVNIMDIIPYEAGSFYVADKGYTDFLRLYKIHTHGSFFVTRAKENLQFRRLYSRAVDKTTGVQSDHIGKLTIYKSRNEYTEKLRRIKFYDCEHDKELVFLTNNMDLKASEIAFLYKTRWEVDLFFYGKLYIIFKNMKQNFQLHYFYGENENAIYTQVWCTLIAQLLLTVTQKIAQAKKAFSVVASLVRIHLISNLDVNELLRSTKRIFKSKSIPPGLQLSFNMQGVNF